MGSWLARGRQLLQSKGGGGSSGGSTARAGVNARAGMRASETYGYFDVPEIYKIQPLDRTQLGTRGRFLGPSLGRVVGGMLLHSTRK